MIYRPLQYHPINSVLCILLIIFYFIFKIMLGLVVWISFLLISNILHFKNIQIRFSALQFCSFCFIKSIVVQYLWPPRIILKTTIRNLIHFLSLSVCRNGYFDFHCSMFISISIVIQPYHRCLDGGFYRYHWVSLEFCWFNFFMFFFSSVFPLSCTTYSHTLYIGEMVSLHFLFLFQWYE